VRGNYVCLLSEELVAPELKAGLFFAYRLQELPLSRPALLATRRGAELQPVAKIFRDIVCETCKKYYPG